MAEGMDEVWRRKLVVKGLPPCTTDLIINYLEVISALCVSEEDGVTFHEGITHTAMVTFTEELTEKDFQKILTQGKQKPLEGKQLTFQRLTEPTSSMLVRNVPRGLTRDNLMYYFESRHAGCHDGEVENCEVDYDGGFAVIKFSSSQVARAVMAKQEHVPAKGTVVQVEPYFPEFHESILKELKNLERTSRSKKPQKAADGQREHCVPNKGSSYAKSPLLPTPSYETCERTNPLWETTSHHNSSREAFLEDSTFTENTEYHDSRGNVFSEEYNQRGFRGYGRRRSRNKSHRGRGRGKSPRNSWSDCCDPEGFEEPVCEPQFQRGRRPSKYQVYHQRDFATDENFQEQNKSYRQELKAKRSSGSKKRDFAKQSSVDHGPKGHHSVSRPVITLDADCNFVAVQSPPAPLPKRLDRFPRNEKENDSDFFDSELIKYPEPTSEVDEQSSDFQESAVSRSSFTNPQKSEETEILQQELENKSAFEKHNETVQNPEELMKNKKLEEENERLKKELEKLKSQKAEKIEVPGYKLRLLSNFAQECKTCSVTFFEHEGKVQFSGSEDGCLAARVDLLSRIQVLADDTTHLPADITSILQTAKGQMYLSEIKRTYPGCSADLQGQVLMCASHKMEEVQSFLQEIKRNIIQEDIQLRITEISRCPEFPALKKRLEEDLMVKVTLSDSGTLTVHGINGDVHMAKRDITDFVERQKPGRKIFQIQGFLAARACRQWFSMQLFDARDLIIKNGKILQEQESEGRYMLQYECQQSVLDSVEKKLDSIKNNIHSAPFDLKHPFQSKTDYALVVNGLYAAGLKQYCAGLEQTLLDQRLNALISISLPPGRCHLPKFRFKMIQRDKKIQSLPKRTGRWTGRKRYRHRSYHQRPFKPYAITVGFRSTSVAIQSGDITVEAVDALVSVVGDDLDLKGTAVGGAILKKCPTAGQLLNPRKLQRSAFHFAQMVQQQPAAATGVQVIPTQLPPAQTIHNQLQTSYILHAVISRARSPQNVTTQVKTIVEECLQLAVRSGKTSIAFPPIGAGRKFQFPEDTVVAAMISTITQFLSSQVHALQSVKIVIYDKNMAKKFKDSLKQTFPSAVASDEDEEEDHSVDSDDDDDDNAAVASGDAGDLSSNDSDSESQLIDLEEDQSSSTEEILTGTPVVETTGSVCTLRPDDIPRVRKAVVENLKANFLCQETVPNMETIRKLSQKDRNEIEDEAVKNQVVLTMQKTSDGKQKLVLRGQPQGMSRTVNFISEKVMTHLKKMKDEEKHRRSKGTLDKHEFPTYWKSNEMGDLESWVRKRRTEGKLFKVNDKEKSAVEQLVKATWMQQYVGAGLDGTGLSHQGIQVHKVERLENPDLWETYKHRRDRMYINHGSSRVHPIEKLGGSKKPVLTTENMLAGNPLRREIYPFEVNEHYLFHGTKKEYITNIIASGLDNRIASDKAMLGSGLYAAESATKADQYTDDKRQRTSGHKTMILMRVLLGEPYINTSKNPVKFKRPPCKNCTKDICLCNSPSFYDSVIDDAGRNFREFVIYEACMCYPEYFITYQRV